MRSRWMVLLILALSLGSVLATASLARHVNSKALELDSTPLPAVIQIR
ncbi:hypothetical protein IAI18_02110 [Acetobacteraceae bacterium H6797]|nr:hypothetical protein [Acetobacteraceae bacterium H6797]